MRIIAGQRRGHKFDGPRGGDTRPTSDLVRESIFNILGDLVVDRAVVDLFAGTGALGLEALSRGAARALFVERNRDNIALIRRNLATLRFEDRARVLVADAYRWARALAADPEPLVVLIDPPYRDYDHRPRLMNQMLARLVELLAPGSVIALEASRGLDADVLPGPDLWDIRRYGGTEIAIRLLPAPNLDLDPDHSPATGGETTDAAR